MYHMTVYDEDGKVLFNDALSATSDEEAKKAGYAWLAEHGHENKPHRIFHTTGRLVSFKPHQFDLKTGKATKS
ncbi:YhzD family protein [Thermoflavimicrobium dichotomicum]|uniref:YhzD-like protein n=1 Tax=Thermoflavimicrobium dichotomicum TaxID=46223 RepID=A0A1I3LL10_9BACL|nr:YhzD family protein [Thermoflavimicrobium dichotomicum]SFI85441.1 YhzD-like protein [Thermoflavimicrobium dichotomicum]